MAAEDDYITRESPAARSDLVISGEPSLTGPVDSIAILRTGRTAG